MSRDAKHLDELEVPIQPDRDNPGGETQAMDTSGIPKHELVLYDFELHSITSTGDCF